MKLMVNAFHYFTTVLIWGGSWLAIKYQLGIVPAEVSIVYRFGIAAVLLAAFCLLSGRSLRFSARQHAFIALQGLLLFGFNYLMFYVATPHLTTGLVALIFSSIIFFNIVFGALIFRQPMRPQVVLGALVGIVGIALIFRPELAAFDLGGGALLGIGLSVLATALASLGNMAAVRNQRAGLPIIESNALGMAYGAAAMAAVALARGVPFTFDPTALYIGSLLYLSIFASAIAFWSYLSLVSRIGADKGAYTTVALPVVALGLSTIFEDFVWTDDALFGVALVVAGNVLALARLRRRRSAASDAAAR